MVSREREKRLLMPLNILETMEHNANVSIATIKTRIGECRDATRRRTRPCQSFLALLSGALPALKQRSPHCFTAGSVLNLLLRSHSAIEDPDLFSDFGLVATKPKRIGGL